MEPDNMDTHTGKDQSEDIVIFAPLEEIKCIERVIDNLETIRRELQKVEEGMKLIPD